VPNPFLPLHPSLAASSGGRTRLRQDSSCSFFRGVRRVRSDPACTSAMLVKLWDFCRIGVSVFFSASLCAVHSDTSDTTPASTERWCKWAQAVRPATVAKVNMTSGSTETVLDRGSVTACRETTSPVDKFKVQEETSCFLVVQETETGLSQHFAVCTHHPLSHEVSSKPCLSPTLLHLPPSKLKIAVTPRGTHATRAAKGIQRRQTRAFFPVHPPRLTSFLLGFSITNRGPGSGSRR
jgi:hypothetical protein